MTRASSVPARDALVSGVAAEWPGHAESPGETSLVLGDAADALFNRLEESGKAPRRWHRFFYPGQELGPWPAGGCFDQVWLRIPRSGRETRMLLAVAAARISPQGLVAIYGARDEGIRSVDKHRPESLDPFRTEWVKRRCRVLLCHRDPAGPAGPASDALETWRSESIIDWGGGPKPWVFYPGVFAHGRLDPATQLLIEHIPPLPKEARILDYGAGSGIIGAALLQRAPSATVHLLDPDAVALAAAAVNVPGATLIHATDMTSALGPYDLIVSNPPIHEGKEETFRVIQSLARDGRRALTPKGSLAIVVQRRLRAEALLDAAFRHVTVVADDGPFRVLSARP